MYSSDTQIVIHKFIYIYNFKLTISINTTYLESTVIMYLNKSKGKCYSCYSIFLILGSLNNAVQCLVLKLIGLTLVGGKNILIVPNLFCIFDWYIYLGHCQCQYTFYWLHIYIIIYEYLFLVTTHGGTVYPFVVDNYIILCSSFASYHWK